MLNLSVPRLARSAAQLPADGVGLLRAEFLALSAGRHPSAILEDGGEEEYVRIFRDGLREVAEAFHPRPVTYRATDLKSNEYVGLAGGERFEPAEANPMLGRRGALRYLLRPGEFALELRALRELRDDGLTGIRLMIPFVRTPSELRSVRELVAQAGLAGPGFELWAMAEVPAFALTPERFAVEVDGISIGSNDLFQLVLGVDRDSAELANRYPVDDEAFLEALRRIIAGVHAAGRTVSICGDQPGEHPELVRCLIEAGIDAISVLPTAFPATLAAVEELCG
jgi:pyruvate,water dikinase